MVATQVLSAPSLGQVFLQCKNQNSSIESCTFLTRAKFHWHGTSHPRAYSSHAKYHAIALTNLARWRPHNATNKFFEIEHIFPNVFCIMVGVLQIPVTKRLLTSSLADWNMYLMHSNLKDNMVSVQDDDSKDKAEATGFPVWIISLDLSKAFDRVH